MFILETITFCGIY